MSCDPICERAGPARGSLGGPASSRAAGSSLHDAVRRLFERRFGAPPLSAQALAADGSKRRMTRLTGAEGTAVAVEGPDAEENRAFLSFSRDLMGIGLPVPEVFAADEAAGVYLVQDLGDTTLFQALSAARAREPGAFPPSMVAVYRRVIETLPRFQVDGGRVIDYRVAHPLQAFDRRSIRWDLDYFKYHFLKLAHIPFNEDRLERDFDRLTALLLEADASHFLYRDFQSRNVMLVGDTPWFIDFQGGRRGALPYDVASLLYDAKAEIPPSLRESLLEHYLAALSERIPLDEEAFRRAYPGFVLVRILQAMGAYGYRGFYERKVHFLRSVPPAVRNLEALFASGTLAVDLPELRAALDRMVVDPRWARDLAGDAPAALQPARLLTVRVGSFSYARGIPGDPGGHGGGFVFDARGLENPGRLAAYAERTGRDSEVARFLESRTGAIEFVAAARVLVDAQVRAYLARGFTSLQVLFGCTGGRHRSVWCAERLAEGLRAAFPEVEVSLVHEEAERWATPAEAPAPKAPVPAARA
jgi:aminoglycoside/choline kinase family phosphotransferase